MTYKNIWKWVGIGAAIVAILGFIFYVVDVKLENAKLQNRVAGLEGKVNELESELEGLRGAYRNLVISLVTGGKVGIKEIALFLPEEEVEKVEERASEPEYIALTAGWKPQGPGASGGGYKDGILELKTSLNGGDDYAELFLDLRGVRLSRIERNPDGSYNLAGTELIAAVRSDQDFRGDPNHPNGAQFLLKNKQWDNLIGTWLNINDAMMTPTGMEIFYEVPNHEISANVAGISLKFTIGSNSNETYNGSFFVKSIKIVKKN